MRRVVLAACLAAAAAVVASSVVLARQTPQAPNVPGLPTQARMVVVNGASEAVPVVLVAGGEMQPVTVVGTPTVIMSGESVVTTRSGRQGWEYRSVGASPDQDLTAALNRAGVEGWEAVGVISGFGAPGQVLMKRQR